MAKRETAAVAATKGPTPIDAFSNLTINVQSEAKVQAVVSFYETQEFYHDGISENDFIKYALSPLGCIEIPKALYDYYAQAYKFHVAKATHDEVYARTDGQAFKDLYNYMVGQYKPGMTAIEFQNHLFPGYP